MTPDVKVLAVLYCYPPMLVPAAVCYAKLMLGLRRNGADVEIVTIAPDSFVSPGGPLYLDHALAAVVQDEATQHVIWSPEGSLWVRAAKLLDPSRRLTYRWLEPKKREWTYSALRYLRRKDLSRYDVLLTCSQPHANHLLGLELKKRTGLPWIAYFSDPWTENPYAGFRSKRVRAYNRALENRVLSEADLVLFTCEEMRELVARNHPALDAERSGLLPHAFVPDWYAPDPESRATRAQGEVRILQTGSFYGLRTPLPLIAALQRVASKLPLEGHLRIDSYGGMDDKYREQIGREGLAGILGVHGFVSYLKALSMMKEHDALLLIDAPLTTTAESVFLPSKLIDYLGSSTPIVAVTPDHGATARVVREVGGVVCPLERPGELDDFLLRVVRGGTIHTHPRADEVARYDYREVGRSLLAMMERCTRRAG
jgi:glycosyltransferase involved in cell wall biosynthesis